MATRKKLEAACALLGATLDWSDMAVNVDAPHGMVWTASGTHHLCTPFENQGGQAWRAEAYADALDRMGHGLEECPDGDACDVCAEGA